MGCCIEANTNLNTINPYFVSEHSPERKEFFVKRHSYLVVYAHRYNYSKAYKR